MSENPKKEEISPKVEAKKANNQKKAKTTLKPATETTEIKQVAKSQPADKPETALNAKLEATETTETSPEADTNAKKKTETAEKGEKEEKKVKKTAAISSNYLSILAQSKTVLRQWGNNTPQFDCPLVPYRTLQQESARFDALLKSRIDQTSDKRGNTMTLTEANRQINQAVAIFRRYLKAEYPLLKDFAQYYQYYGFVLNDKGTYLFPSDNDQRATAVTLVVSRFNEANNPFAGREYGLAHWTQLAQNHNQAWNLSDDLRSTRASLVSDTARQYVLLKKQLRDLHDYIKLFYRREDPKAALRMFGFMKESL